jgi:hypothetical protein
MGPVCGRAGAAQPRDGIAVGHRPTISSQFSRFTAPKLAFGPVDLWRRQALDRCGARADIDGTAPGCSHDGPRSLVARYDAAVSLPFLPKGPACSSRNEVKVTQLGARLAHGSTGYQAAARVRISSTEAVAVISTSPNGGALTGKWWGKTSGCQFVTHGFSRVIAAHQLPPPTNSGPAHPV